MILSSVLRDNVQSIRSSNFGKKTTRYERYYFIRIYREVNFLVQNVVNQNQ